MIKWKMIFLTILAIACIPTLRAQVDTVTILHLNDTHSTLASIGPRDAQLKGSLGGIARAASSWPVAVASGRSPATRAAIRLSASEFFP